VDISTSFFIVIIDRKIIFCSVYIHGQSQFVSQLSPKLVFCFVIIAVCPKSGSN
jgi:hypothetical protein